MVSNLLVLADQLRDGALYYCQPQRHKRAQSTTQSGRVSQYVRYRASRRHRRSRLLS